MMKKFTFYVYTYGENAAHMLCGIDKHTTVTVEARNAMEALDKVEAENPHMVIHYNGSIYDLTDVVF